MSDVPVVILGLDPRIALSPYSPPLGNLSIVRAVSDVRVEPEHDEEAPATRHNQNC
jgi:hypothetical protein